MAARPRQAWSTSTGVVFRVGESVFMRNTKSVPGYGVKDHENRVAAPHVGLLARAPGSMSRPSASTNARGSCRSRTSRSAYPSLRPCSPRRLRFIKAPSGWDSVSRKSGTCSGWTMDRAAGKRRRRPNASSRTCAGGIAELSRIEGVLADSSNDAAWLSGRVRCPLDRGTLRWRFERGSASAMVSLPIVRMRNASTNLAAPTP